jgi:thiamine transport system permease protein
LLQKKLALFFLLAALWLPSLLVFKNFQSFNSETLGQSQNALLSFLQALCSSLATVLIAFPTAWGMLALKRRCSAQLFLLFEFLVLIPSFLPSLMVMISVLVLLPPFPFGFWGVVGMHTLLEVGLVVVFLTRWLEIKLQPYEPLFELYPKSLRVQWALAWPLLQRELFMVFGFLFVFFLTSLSVPIIMSGADRYVSLEYLIYANLKNRGDWNTALHFYLMQIGFILVCLALLPQREIEDSAAQSPVYGGRRKGISMALLAFVPVVLCLLGFVTHFSDGLQAMQREPMEFGNAVVGSLLLAFLSAAFVFIFLLVLSFFYQQASTRKYFQLWTIPSGVVIGFFWQQQLVSTALLSLLVLAAICAFLFLPTLAKLGVYQQIEKIQEQIEMAELLGASQFKIFKMITFPLILPWLALSMGLGSLWTMGDFAISRLFIRSDLTLALKMQSLVEQYRWEHALFLSWFLLLMSAVVFLFFGGFAFVAYKKLK